MTRIENNYVQEIKALRSYFSDTYGVMLGLKEAKDLIDLVIREQNAVFTEAFKAALREAIASGAHFRTLSKQINNSFREVTGEWL